jgi:hypothetical protein
VARKILTLCYYGLLDGEIRCLERGRAPVTTLRRRSRGRALAAACGQAGRPSTSCLPRRYAALTGGAWPTPRPAQPGGYHHCPTRQEHRDGQDHHYPSQGTGDTVEGAATHSPRASASSSGSRRSASYT